MYINVREQCTPVGTSEFIRSVWYEIYWTGSIWHTLLGCSVHSQRSESYWQVELYLKRYFSPLLQRPFAITAHPLPLKSELIWRWLHWSPPPCLKEGCFWVLGTWRRCGLPSCAWECSPSWPWLCVSHLRMETLFYSKVSWNTGYMAQVGGSLFALLLAMASAMLTSLGKKTKWTSSCTEHFVNMSAYQRLAHIIMR